MLSNAAKDKNPKAFWNFLKTGCTQPSNDIKLEDWFEHFLNLLKPHLENEAWDEYVALDDTFIENEDLDKPITETEVLYAIQNLKTGKSPRIDGISSQFLKAFAEYIAPFLTKLFHFYFEHGFFPT